ncbi:MAG: FAD-binding oxidoreductase [Candidatus Muiribacteriota bacterium]
MKYYVDIEKRLQNSNDYSLCDEVIPERVYYPDNAGEVSEIIKQALKEDKKISPRGGGSGVNGGCIPQNKQDWVINTGDMNNYEIFATDFMAWAEPGVITLDFQNACEKKGFCFPPDPSSADISTIGGNIACGAGGMRGFKYGTIRDYVLQIEFVDGLGNIHLTGTETLKRSAGYNLTNLLVGAEGTLGIVTGALLKLIPLPEYKKSVFLQFTDYQKMLDFFLQIMNSGIVPSNAELMDTNTLKVVNKNLKEVELTQKCALLIEVDGASKDYVDYQFNSIVSKASKNQVIFGEKLEKIWEERKKLRINLEKIKPNVFSEDFVLKYSKIPGFLTFSEQLCNRKGVFFCNFGHIIDGNIHFSVVYDSKEEKDKVESIIHELAEYVIQNKGTISGEHGIGKYKTDLLQREIGNQGIFFKKIKEIFDPLKILNPGKIIK